MEIIETDEVGNKTKRKVAPREIVSLFGVVKKSTGGEVAIGLYVEDFDGTAFLNTNLITDPIYT